MDNEILNRLQSITDIECYKLTDSDRYWQEKIETIVTDSINNIYLVFPKTTQELAETIELAHQNQWRIIAGGSGSKLTWGNLTNNIQLVISSQKCDQVIEHAIGDLTVTVEAGIKLVDLQQQLQAEGQFLPIDPAYPQQATIGGIVATADTGSWRQRYGGIRDLVLGLSFVRADGKVAKAGGRVVKNVAGYDLMKLFAGAYGTLGYITEVTLRTYPLPEASQTLIIIGAAAEIESLIKTIRNSSLTPTAMDLLSAKAIELLELGNSCGLIMRWQTIIASIESQIATVTEIARSLNLKFTVYRDLEETNFWQRINELYFNLELSSAIIGKIGIIPTASVKLLLELNSIDPENLAIIHAGSGIGTVKLFKVSVTEIEKLRLFCEGLTPPRTAEMPAAGGGIPSSSKGGACLPPFEGKHPIVGCTPRQQHGGYLTILDAPRDLKPQLDLWGYRGNALSMMQALARQFDPQQILNPGRLI
jgi:glycolate oxidase FAD binding subunit